MRKTVSRRPRLVWRGLVLQLFTVVVLPLSGLLVITAFAGLGLHQQAMRELAAERDALTAQTAADALGQQIQQRITLVHSLASNATSETSLSDLQATLTLFAPLLNDDSGEYLAYLDSEGMPLVSTGDLQTWEGAVDSSLQKRLESSVPGLPISWLGPNQEGGEALQYILVHSKDRAIIAAMVFSPTELIRSSMAAVVDAQSDRSIYVVTPQRQVLFHIGEGDPSLPLVEHPGINQALEGNAGAIYMDQAGDDHVVAYSPVTPFGWAMVIEEPWDTIASRWLRVTENAPLILLPIVVLSILALWFSSRYIVQPLQALESQAASLGWGDFHTIENPVGGIEEIRNLQDELIHLAHKVQMAQKGLRDYIGAITLGQEDERRRLARELHDDTLQSLIALNQRLQLVHLSLDETPQARQQSEMLFHLQELTGQTIQDLRRMTRALRPVYLEELGLVAALEMLCREAEQAYPLEIDFQKIGSEQRLPPEVELALYRIVQEAVNNIVKHAEAGHAVVRISYAPEQVNLEVQDDGKGFNIPDSPSAFAPGGHFGLLGLFERAEMVGAKLEITSQPGTGCRVRLSLPTKALESAVNP